MTYPIHPGPSFPANKSGKLPNPLSLAGEHRPVQTSHWPFFNSDAFYLDDAAQCGHLTVALV